MKEEKRTLRPVYKTSFCIEEELYESPEAKEPFYSRREVGRFSFDLVRALTFGVAALAASAVFALLLTHSQND